MQVNNIFDLKLIVESIKMANKLIFVLKNSTHFGLARIRSKRFENGGAVFVFKEKGLSYTLTISKHAVCFLEMPGKFGFSNIKPEEVLERLY